jgi:hypothetical protein
MAKRGPDILLTEFKPACSIPNIAVMCTIKGSMNRRLLEHLKFTNGQKHVK